MNNPSLPTLPTSPTSPTLLTLPTLPSLPTLPTFQISLKHRTLCNVRCTMEHIVLGAVGLWNCYFFLISYYRNI